MSATPVPEPVLQDRLLSIRQIAEELELLLRHGSQDDFARHLSGQHGLATSVDNAKRQWFELCAFYEKAAACMDTCTWVDIIFPPNGYVAAEPRSPVRKLAVSGTSPEEAAAELGLCTAKQLAKILGVPQVEMAKLLDKLKRFGLEPMPVSVVMPSRANLYDAGETREAFAKWRKSQQLKAPRKRKPKKLSKRQEETNHHAGERGLVTSTQAAEALDTGLSNPSTFMHRLKPHGLKAVEVYKQAHLYRMDDVKAANRALEASKAADLAPKQG